jgi:DUF1009 family protein
VERSLGLMCGAGPLPARMAEHARRQGWRVVAYDFGAAPDLAAHADHVVKSAISDLAPVLASLHAESVSGVLFCGKFWLGDVLRVDRADHVSAGIAARAGSFADTRLAGMVTRTLGDMGIEVLDQRPFFGDWLGACAVPSARTPTAEEWNDVHHGFRVARVAADAGVGQRVVVKHGVVAAVEALEGTTEAIARGTALAGPGAVIVKVAARDQDYRFDMPAVGPDSIDAAVCGRAAVVAVQAGAVVVLDRETTAARAASGGIALVTVDD